MVDQSRHRNQEEIVADILSAVLEGKRKTRIMYSANLSYGLTVKYLERLQRCGLIEYDSNDKKYLMTREGEDYLEKYNEYRDAQEVLRLKNLLFVEKRDVLESILTKEQIATEISKS